MIRLYEQTKKSEKLCSRSKKGPRPKIKILIERSGFRSLRGPTCQISWSYDFKPRRLRGPDKQTDKHTDRQTDNAIYIVDYMYVCMILFLLGHWKGCNAETCLFILFPMCWCIFYIFLIFYFLYWINWYSLYLILLLSILSVCFCEQRV